MKKRKKARIAPTAPALEYSSTATVESRERLYFTGFLALMVHAIIILGISFSVNLKAPVAPTLEVTLAQYKDSEPPEKADFLAQHQQKASGTETKKAQLTTDTKADFADTDIRDVDPRPEQNVRVSEVKPDKQLVSTTDVRARATAQKKQDDQVEQPSVVEGDDKTIKEANREIASLQAKLARQRQRYAKRPRVKTLTSVATRASVDAAYLHSWQEKVELLGNLHYPEEARRQKLYGQLRLLVSLLPDGTVYQIDVLESSNQRVLDDAAINIVREASPFAPFPPELRKDVDRLEIIRTWKFEKGDILTSE